MHPEKLEDYPAWTLSTSDDKKKVYLYRWKKDGRWYIQRGYDLSSSQYYAKSVDASESPFTEGISWFIVNSPSSVGRPRIVFELKNCVGKSDCFLCFL